MMNLATKKFDHKFESSSFIFSENTIKVLQQLPTYRRLGELVSDACIVSATRRNKFLIFILFATFAITYYVLYNTSARLPLGEDSDPVARERRNKVREMTQHAWENYKQYAWGKNELKPLSNGSHNGSPFGAHELGLTIVDSLDTLYIMGLTKEYREGRDWVEEHFQFNVPGAAFSVFETNIRFVGGFLAMYALTGDSMYKVKAQEVADKLLPAFQTTSGIPVNLVKIGAQNNSIHGSSENFLADIGTLHLEFSYLSDITGNPLYRQLVMNIRRKLKEIEKPDGLYLNSVNTGTGKFGGSAVSIDACGDSFYEYLLKAWIQSGHTDSEAREMYDAAMTAVVNNLIHTSSEGLIYAARMNGGVVQHKMGHLACFAGGLFALGAATKLDENSKRYMEIGKGITNTCHETYIRSPTHLGPEEFEFNKGFEAKSKSSQAYILRPETFESYFVLWRLTKDKKYRNWGWDAIQAIETYCKTPGGYSGITNVYSVQSGMDDVQQSFFVAETLKYLYLLYSDDSLLSLDNWVFNTEAHPLPIKANSMYPRWTDISYGEKDADFFIQI